MGLESFWEAVIVLNAEASEEAFGGGDWGNFGSEFGVLKLSTCKSAPHWLQNLLLSRGMGKLH